jgi:hypothetical protein
LRGDDPAKGVSARQHDAAMIYLGCRLLLGVGQFRSIR